MAAEQRLNIPTREELKKKKQEEKEKTKKRARIRLVPIWLRLVLLVLGMAVSLAAGAIVGYGVLGDGKPLDALKPSTWQHIIDLVEKEKE